MKDVNDWNADEDRRVVVIQDDVSLSNMLLLTILVIEFDLHEDLSCFLCM